MDMDELPFDEDNNLQQRPKRARAKKSSNAVTIDPATTPAFEYQPTYYEDNNNSGDYVAEMPEGMPNADSPAT